MKAAKTFDCVRMKDEIQQAILHEMQSTPREDQHRKAEEEIQSDPALADLWRRATPIVNARAPFRSDGG